MRRLIYLVLLFFSFAASSQTLEVELQRRQAVLNLAPVSSFEPEYQAVLDQATLSSYVLPSPTDQTAQNAILAELKSTGVWDSLDLFVWYKGSGSLEFKYLNWKNPLDTFVVGANSFVNANTGITGDGAQAIQQRFSPTYFNTDGAASTIEVVTKGTINQSPFAPSGSTNGGLSISYGAKQDWVYIKAGTTTNSRANMDLSNGSTNIGTVGISLSEDGVTITGWVNGTLVETDGGNTGNDTGLSTGIYVFNSSNPTDLEIGFIAIGGNYSQINLYNAVNIN